MKRFLFSVLLFISAIGAAFPQSVGLVLSGGGAKGLAHIGVIKVLEDHNIPIDYVAGTSIGAIIAGLYATGYTPEEMLELFNSKEFRMWSTGKIDKESLYYFKKKDDFPESLRIDIAKKKEKLKLILPVNLVPEQQIDFAFMEIMAQNTAACNKDFDKLMVPFRCVSTDIYRNEAVIHNQGYLEEAIRASMTIPLVYKPIEIDGVLLYDGGIQNNFPVDVMVNDFRPDIVIGHKVAEDGDKADPDDLFKQIENMVMQLTNYKIPDSVGILIESKMRDVGLLDFHKVNYAYSRGIESALHMIDSIEQRVERRMSSDVLAQKRNDFKKKKPELLFNNVQVEGITDNMQRKYIIQSVKNKENIFDIDQLRESYFKLISDEHIKAIRPIARYNSMTGLYDLQLKVEPRQPLDLELGGNVTTRSYSFGFIQANYKGFKTVSYTLTSNVYFGRFYNSFLLGGRIDSPSRKPFYVSAYKTFNQWDYFATSTDLYFSDIRPPYVLRRENNFSIEAGVPYTKTGLFTIGASQANLTDTYYQTKDFKQDDKLDQTKFNSYVFDATFNIKKFDYKQYPTEGANKFLGLYFISGTENFKPGTTSPITDAFTANHNYFQLRGTYERYFRYNKWFNYGIFGETVWNNNKLFNNYLAATLLAPAFTPTPNSKSLFLEQYSANQYLAAGVKAIAKWNDNLHFRLEGYGFVPVQKIISGEQNAAKYHDKLFRSWHPMGMAAMVYQTNIGPLSAEVNYYDKAGQKFFFSLNLGYIIFNKKGLE